MADPARSRAAPSGPGPAQPWSWRRRALLRLGAPVLSGGAGVLWRSLRIEAELGVENVDALAAAGAPVIPCFWHQQLLVSCLHLRRLRESGFRVGWLISPSADGELATRVAERWGIEVVRGSATRSGVQALRRLYRALVHEAISPVMLPDGPKGPPRAAKPGALVLAQLANAAILPMAGAVSSVLELRSWDRMWVPRPFARAALVFGTPIRVPREGCSDGLRDESRSLERELNELTARAAAALGQ